MAGVTAASLAFAAPAAAAPPSKVLSQSPTDSDPKTETALCPNNTRVLGGGGYLIGAPHGEVHIDQLEPLSDGSGFQVTAREDENGFAGMWSLVAIAICAPPPADLLYVRETSAPAIGLQTVNVACPGNRRVLSAGGRVNNGQGQVVLDHAFPSPGLTSVTAGAFEDQNAYGQPWTVTAYAVCASANPQLATATYPPVDSNTPKFVSVSCQQPNTYVVGAGFRFSGGNGEVTLHALDVSSSTTVRLRADEDEEPCST